MQDHAAASIGSRFTAQFIDGLIALGLAVASYWFARRQGIALEWMFALWFGYLMLCDALPRGQSLGKRMVGIAVVQAGNGRPCSWWRSIVRNLSLAILGVLDCLPLFGSQRRRVGDYLAGTLVVRV